MTTPQRATRYTDPTYTPQEKGLLDFFKKLPDADRLAIQEQASKPKPPIGRDALAELMREYLKVLETRGRAPRTIEIYGLDLRRFWQFTTFEERDIVEIGLPILHDYFNYLARYQYHRNSISRMLTALKGFLWYLRQQGVLNRAQLPPAKMFVTKEPQSIPSHLNMLEVQRLIEAPDPVSLVGIRDRAILEVLYGAGLRVSELVGLDVSDLELRYKTLLVRRGKGDVDRWAKYGSPARRALVEYLKESRPKLKAMSRADFHFPQGKESPRQDPNALFLNRYGERITVRSIQKIVRQYAKLVNISQRVYPHLLCHSFATHMIENGASIPAIKELLGHANVSTTQVYTHVTQAEARKALLEHHPHAKEGG